MHCAHGRRAGRRAHTIAHARPCTVEGERPIRAPPLARLSDQRASTDLHRMERLVALEAGAALRALWPACFASGALQAHSSGRSALARAKRFGSGKSALMCPRGRPRALRARSPARSGQARLMRTASLEAIWLAQSAAASLEANKSGPSRLGARRALWQREERFSALARPAQSGRSEQPRSGR